MGIIALIALIIYLSFVGSGIFLTVGGILSDEKESTGVGIIVDLGILVLFPNLMLAPTMANQLEEVRTIENEYQMNTEKIQEVEQLLPENKKVIDNKGEIIITDEGLKELKVETELKKKMADLIKERKNIKEKMYEIQVSPYWFFQDIKPVDNTLETV